MDRPKLSLIVINAMDQAQFTDTLGSLFEHSPWIARETWPARPFHSRPNLHHALVATLAAAPGERHVALIQAHPDLVGRAALAGTLTPASTGEQAAAGLDHLSPQEIAQFTEFNAAYQAKFGFPFVICARLNKKDSILRGFATRLHNDRDQEIATALHEIAKIAELRLADLVADTSGTG